MAKSENQIFSDVKERQKIEFPKDYKVVLINDNITTFQCVVAILEKVFHKNEAEAKIITIEVDRKGRGVAGIYTEDIARTKASIGMELARAQGYPLQIIVEEN